MSARTDMPVKLVGAAHFDRNAEDFDPPSLIRIAKQSGMFDDLRATTDYRSPSVRRRMPGEWGLAFLAFAASPTADIRPWWRDSAAELWWECGFHGRPKYDIVYARFTELEERDGAEAFFEATAKLIRLAIVATTGLIGRDIHTDAAEAESNARMFHDCQPDEDYPWQQDGKNHRRTRGRKDAFRTTQKLDTSVAKAIRGKAAEVLPDDEDAPLIGDADELVYDPHRELLRIKVAGHWRRITDPTAGCRTYTGPNGAVKSWIGTTHMRLVSNEVGLPLVTEVASASKQEYDIYPGAYAKLKYILDGVPRSVIADKGLAIKRVLQMHSDDGVFSIMPFRGHRNEVYPVDRERYDRHGIPRCENCGGRTKFVSFAKRPKPRVFFECARKPFAECEGRQSLLCEEDPRFILPLWRDTELYQALRAVGIEYERAHRVARQRNGTGGNNFYTRPKRKGSDWQQVVANASNVVDWLKLCWRNGWLPGSQCTAKLSGPDEQYGVVERKELLARRRNRGLEAHYDARAWYLGLGPERLTQYPGSKPTEAKHPDRSPGGPPRRALTPLPAAPVGWPPKDANSRPASKKPRRPKHMASVSAAANGGPMKPSGAQPAQPKAAARTGRGPAHERIRARRKGQRQPPAAGPAPPG